MDVLKFLRYYQRHLVYLALTSATRNIYKYHTIPIPHPSQSKPTQPPRNPQSSHGPWSTKYLSITLHHYVYRVMKISIPPVDEIVFQVAAGLK